MTVRGSPPRLRSRSLAAIVGAAALLAVLVAPTAAAGKVKTFSSGPINRAIPDPVGGTGFEIAPSIKVQRKGRVKDVNVAVRISHPDARQLEIGASSIPSGGVLRFNRLKENGQLNEPAGADFGTGAPACEGAMFTVFDSQAAIPIFGVAPPFAGRFQPATPLSVFNGSQLRGRWYLDLSDVTPGGAGILHCWQITVRYRPPPKPR